MRIEQRDVGTAEDPPASRGRTRVDACEFATDGNATRRYPGARRRQARCGQRRWQPDQVGESRRETEKADGVVYRRMELDGCALVETVQACEVGEIGPGLSSVGNLDLVGTGRSGDRGAGRRLRGLESGHEIGGR